MAHQSPAISIPKKVTEEVDWTTPIRHLIAQSYGENPDNYAAECAALQRCRQDAVRGAGSEMTARDLLYKYFGQLELLELRFAEIRVNFPWHDAFTNKLTTQTSLAYEKASIIFQIAATHSAIAASQNRSDPEGLKRAFHYFRTSAGMLTYINDNFLHAPSTDLSREVVKFLVGIMIAQATEVFFEKCTDEKKGSALVAKIANQAASMYTSLCEEVKEFMGKGIFDRNWVTILQIKAKYFTSLAQFHRALADNNAGKHGDALARFTAAETSAKEASRTAASFGGMFMTQMSPNLPPDAGSTIQELTKIHHALCTEKKNEAQKDNDLIYNAPVPAVETLPNIDKLSVATPIPIQEVYSAPDVQKTIGPDLFIKLVPLSVHESASVYSEEKAKLVRAEVERAETAEGEVRSALDALGVKSGLGRYKAMVEGLHGDGASELPPEVKRMREDITLVEEREPVTRLLAELSRLRDTVRTELDTTQRELETESRNCEALRVKYEHLWTQQPSAALTRTLRQDLKAHLASLEAAVASDRQVDTLWESVRGDISLLLSPQVEEVFRQSADQGPGGSLLDLDPSNEDRDEEERAKISNYVDEIEERLGRLNKIAVERKNVLKDLKEKIQSDDVSHLLLLNRRNQSVEPTLFAAELEKFKPYQSRLAATVHHEQIALQEISKMWKSLRELAGRGPGARKWEEREKRKRDTVRRFERARDGYMEVRDGLAKGLQFYNDLQDLSATLRRNVKTFIAERTLEQETLVAQAEAKKRAAAPTSSPPPLAEKPKPPPPPPQSRPNLDQAFSSMSLRGPSSPPPALPSQPLQQRSPYPPPLPPPSQPSYSTPPQAPVPPASAPPPQPPPPPSDPYANMFSSSGLSSQFSFANRTPYDQQQQQQQQQQPMYGSSPYPLYPPPPSAPPQSQQQTYPLPPGQPPQPPQPYYNYSSSYTQSPPQTQPTSIPSMLPPPPPPITYQHQQYGGPPAPPPPPDNNTGQRPLSYQGYQTQSAASATPGYGQYGAQGAYGGYR